VRVVSLLPSATEIVYALGLGDQLVGVTFECDEPAPARRDATVVVGGRDTSDMSPGEIDAYVRAEIAAGRDLYTLHAGALAALDPELILTQDLCRVCALPAGHVSEALDYLGCTAEVLSLDPRTLDDVLATILTIGAHCGAAEQAGQLVAALRQRLVAVTDQLAGSYRPTVAVIEWVDPPFSAGHWVPDLVTAAAGRPVAAHPGGRRRARGAARTAPGRRRRGARRHPAPGPDHRPGRRPHPPRRLTKSDPGPGCLIRPCRRFLSRTGSWSTRAEPSQCGIDTDIRTRRVNLMVRSQLACSFQGPGIAGSR
jgi:iron complex transport system substrate-binding protein